MQKGKLSYVGKAKDMYETDDPRLLWMVYKDQATAGDGAKKEQIAGKGELNQKITRLIFAYLADHGIKTHLKEIISDTEELVEKLDMFELEVVLRNLAAGSIVRRLGIEKGTEFKGGMIEFYYKSDDLHDPLLTDDNLMFIHLATPAQLQEIKRLTLEVNTLLSELFKRAGLILVDFKLEFGTNADGEVVLGDEFSPDNCRLWDVHTHESFDKDIFRNSDEDMIPFYKAVYERLCSALS
ncbi:phosphoribosylaminoimidazolesuccinocarboxamide synthase [Fannyhessea vaginae]|uniref:phosphoribosylaminoimidazolesuccinocarboxamide synthase n=1 Tax=Fannyhessea vaginae TaxID=82135 RepID=UPI0023F2D297|nr:phosphoribosylaminoimidazolesuccinocarboxamide synthase [Fannyhessea vaginae]